MPPLLNAHVLSHTHAQTIVAVVRIGIYVSDTSCTDP